MTKKQKKMLLRILIAAGLMGVLLWLPIQGLPRFFLWLAPYLVIGYDVLAKAARGLWYRQLLDENFLMAIATLGALVLGVTGSGDYVEAVAVMLLYQTGELFQSCAVGKSRRSIAALMDIRPDWAYVEQDGQVVQVDPEAVAPGTHILVRPGDRLPLDGVVVTGSSMLDTASLTGESLPREVVPGDPVISGCINLSGELTVRTTKPFGQSTVARILELVENASSAKAPAEQFISRFARIYTPAVCASALALAVIPPAVSLLAGWDPAWTGWLYRALTFLVASCPCALVISIPLTFFAGLGGASKAGILVKGSNYLEALAKADTVVFDKTGTLTQGTFAVNQILSETLPADTLLEYAACAEASSSHPISKSLQAAWGKPVDHSRVTDLRELSGHGVMALVDGVSVAVGSHRLMDRLDIPFTPCQLPGTAVYVAVDGRFAGCILISDQPKPTAAQAIRALRAMGIDRCVMLTGDRPAAAAQTAAQLGIADFHSQLLPDQKVRLVEDLLARQKKGRKLVFVGDGINDAPVLTRADIGVAMGALGSDAAIEAADAVLMDDDPMKLPTAIRHARRCMAIVKENLIFAIGVKLLSLVLVALGLGGMGLAVFADVGVMVLAVLNAIRALRLR